MRAKIITAIALIIGVGAAVYLLRPKDAMPSPIVGNSVAAVPEEVVAPPAPEAAVTEAAAEPPPVMPPEPSPRVEPESVAAVDLQGDPKTAIVEFLRLFREGNLETLMANFMAPSEQATLTEDRKTRALEQMRAMQIPGSPAFEMGQLMIEAVESIQGAEPTYNEAGDRATYQLNVVPPEGSPARAPKTLVLVREDGRWYLKSLN